MSTHSEGDLRFLKESSLFQEFIAERDEILRHKWIESEKAGYDIGFEKALLEWVIRHRSGWLERRHRSKIMSEEVSREPGSVEETARR